MKREKELSQNLLEYGLHNSPKRILAKENMPIDFIHIPKSKDEIVELYPSRNYSTIVKRGVTDQKGSGNRRGFALTIKSHG